MDNEFLRNLNPHFYDPIDLAEFIIKGYKNAPDLRNKLPLPSAEEIERWAITEPELERCADEFYILMVVGDTVIVKRNKSFEFYSSFLRLLTPRLADMLYGQQTITASEGLIKVIERYIELLDTEQMVEFACTYTERVFGGNPHESAIFAADLWNRAFDMMIKTMGATKEMFTGFIRDEEECRLLGEEIALTKFEVQYLQDQMKAGTEGEPRQKIESLLQKIKTCWRPTKLEDNETKLLVLHDCWYLLKQLYISIADLSEKERSNFNDQFALEYIGRLMSIAGVVTQVGSYGPGSLPTDRVLRVTEREIALGRLPEDIPFHQDALKAKAEGKSELLMSAIREELQRNPIIKLADAFSKVKKVKSFLRIFGM